MFAPHHRKNNTGDKCNAITPPRFVLTQTPKTQSSFSLIHNNNHNYNYTTANATNTTAHNSPLSSLLTISSMDTFLAGKEEYNRGNALYLTGKYQECLPYFEEAASKGYPAAYLRLGLCYAEGNGVVKDEQMAVKYYQLAADKGDATAQVSLGFYYQHGKGVVEDKNIAVKYFQLAADQGNTDALCGLGFAYLHGSGVVKDEEKAKKYFYLAVAVQSSQVDEQGLRAALEKLKKT